ncbi:hypothetical protein D3C86_983650 [compost metagenome]
MPPDSCPGRFSAACSRPTRRSISMARPRISSFERSFCVTSISRHTFSSAFFQGISAASWKTRPMRRWRTASIGLTLATEIVPSVGASSPAMTFSKVLLPQPDGPISETKPPFSICRSISCRTRLRTPAVMKSTAMPEAWICTSGDRDAVVPVASAAPADRLAMTARPAPCRAAGGLSACLSG